MTLPFRRRHHDAEDTHDRARALTSRGFLEPLDANEESWLVHHREACAECRLEHDAFAADRELLRSLRDKPIEPPRDLWARTAAALDREAGRRPLASTGSGERGRPEWPSWRRIPLGAAAGALILLVVLGSAILPSLVPPGVQPSAVAVVPSTEPGVTPIPIPDAAVISGMRSNADGSWEFFKTDVDAVCPKTRPECAPPPREQQGSKVNLNGAEPSTVTLSPDNHQLVFASEVGTAGEGKIYVVPVLSTAPPSQPPETPSVSSPGTPVPPSEPPGSAEPTPVATPVGAIEIASGVTIVGEVAYSPDGQWLAFSAAPKDGSTGPDLYLYSIGSGTAFPVTEDHQTYFSAWLGGKVLASHVLVPSDEPTSPGNPKASSGPGPSDGGGQGNGQGQPIEAHAASFILDPATLARTELSQADVWMPVVDPYSRFVAYWSGTLRSTDRVTWQLGVGQLVLDSWSSGETAAPGASAAPASVAPAASDVPVVGPVGHASPIVAGNVAAFRAKFDPEGIRLAVWVGENPGGDANAVGRLHLAVIDPATGTIEATEPLSGEPALRRFSLDVNRLAWVSPPGQDGQESSLRVLGWDGDTFGAIQSEPAPDLFILR